MNDQESLRLTETSLGDEQRRWLVLQHAQFRSNREIRALWPEEFPELAVPAPRLVSYYNPSLASSELGSELREFHASVRQKYIDSFTDVPIANKRWRLEMFQKMVEGVLPRGVSPAILLQALEAARVEIEGRNPRLQVTAGPGDNGEVRVHVVYEDMQL